LAIGIGLGVGVPSIVIGLAAWLLPRKRKSVQDTSEIWGGIEVSKKPGLETMYHELEASLNQVLVLPAGKTEYDSGVKTKPPASSIPFGFT
jgi:hypothetical protein